MAIAMGMVGGLRPPREFARVLRDFDPDLSAQWNYVSQSWWICQRVRRRRLEGSLPGGCLTSFQDIDVPVMQLTSFPGVLDSRVLDLLQKEKAVSLKEYERLLIERQKEWTRQGKKAGKEHIDAATENALDYWYDPTFRNQVGLSPRVRGWSPDVNANTTKDQGQPAA